MSLAEIVELASRRAKSRRAEREVKYEKQGKVAKNFLIVEWNRAMKEFHTDYKLPIVEKDMIILKRHLMKVSTTGFEMLPYVRWVIEHWTMILGQRFSRMVDLPEIPTPRFMVRFADSFLLAYQQKDRIIAESKLTLVERLTRQKVRRGMDEATARTEAVGETTARTRPIPVADEQAAKVKVLVQKIAEVQQLQKRGRIRAKPRKPFVLSEGSFGKWRE